MVKGVFLFGEDMSEAKLLEKINKNSGMIEIIVKTAVAVAVAIISVTLFLGSVKDVIEEIPPRVDRLERRVEALELNNATYMARIDTSLSKLNNDFDMIKLQIIKQGMAHDEKVTRVIHEYPHKEKELEYERSKQ